MTTITKSDAVQVAARKCERAERVYDAANQAVIDAENNLRAAEEMVKEARRSRNAAKAESIKAAEELERAKMTAAGDAVTSAIDWSRAKSSYSGRAGACCCGCSGNHSEDKAAITRQINRIKRLAGEGVTLDINESYVAAEKGDRLYIVYLNDVIA
jgi:hypothetical protein